MIGVTHLFLLLALFASTCSSLRFPTRAPGIIIPDGFFMVGKAQDLTCNYMPMHRKRETVTKINWFFEYDGVRSKFFVSKIQTGETEVLSAAFLNITEEKSSKKVVRMTMLEQRATPIKICCQVEAINNRMDRIKKEKCSSIHVVEGGLGGDLFIQPSKRQVMVDDVVDLECSTGSGGPTPSPKLKIFVNGMEKNGRHNTGLDPEHKGRSILEVQYKVLEEHFDPERLFLVDHPELNIDTILVECKAFYGEHIAHETNTTLRKALSVLNYDYNQPQSRKQDNVQANSIQGSSASRGSHRGSDRNPKSFWRDPARHARHGQVPCHGYILLETGVGGRGAVMRGDVSQDAINSLDRMLPVSPDRHETDQDVVAVLNTLGYHGYKVVGAANSMDNRMVWTLERKYFEFHKDEL